jgi:ribA/ribD-fused uncharacterized protein
LREAATVVESHGDPRSVEDLCRLLGQPGPGITYLFFWGHQPAPGGAVGPGCLSQWWAARFIVDGLEYGSAEHFMMAEKARLFGAAGLAEQIRCAAHPGAAKALGRQIPDFDEEVWSQHRVQIVRRGSLAKFGQHPELADYLLGTGSQVLVEASRGDRIWGIGLSAADPAATRPDQWPGLNLLGFTLMDVRAALLRPAATADTP